MRSGLVGSCGVRWGWAWLLLGACGGEVGYAGHGSGGETAADVGGTAANAGFGATSDPSNGGRGGSASPSGGSGLTESDAGREPAVGTGGRSSSGGARTGAGGSGGWPTGGRGGGDVLVGGSGGSLEATGGTDPIGTGGTRATGGRGGTGGRPAAGSGGARGCGDPVEIPGTKAVYDLASAEAATPSTLDFFDYPWPALARGPADLSRFPNPASASGCETGVTDPLLATLVDAVEPTDYRAYLSELSATFLVGGPNGASVYIRFDEPIDAANLPTPLESLDGKTSPVLLVNVDGASPVRGRLVPVLTRMFDRSRYSKPHTLSILPHPGFPLEPGSLYAAVVRRSLGDPAGALLGSPQALEALKQTVDCGAEPSYVNAFDFLESTYGVPRSDIAAMTVFRAGRPTDDLDSVIAEMDAVGAPSSLASPEVTSTTVSSLGYYLVSGEFETLVYQYGDPPYLPELITGSTPVTFEPHSENGRFLVASPPTTAGGSDTTAPRTERVEFRLSLPFSVADAGTVLTNVPVVVFATGTGGTIDSPFINGVAERLSALGLAVFSTTPVMHAARAHSENIDPTLLALLDAVQEGGADNFVDRIESGDLFFNPLDLQAAKGNSLQAAVDYAWQARLLADVTLQVTLDGSPRTIRFDPKRIYFFGQSQGAATGPLLGVSDTVSALVLSAPSGHLPTNLLGKTKPSDALSIAALLDYLVCDDPSEPLDVHHPVLSLFMYWFEQTDAQNYAPRLIREAPFAGKHIFVTAGISDHYVAPESHNAVTTAARLNQLSPELVSVSGQDLLAALDPGWGFGATYSSLSANVASPTGIGITGAFRQYSSSCEDDHFLYTCYQPTIDDWVEFFATAASGAAPMVTGE